MAREVNDRTMPLENRPAGYFVWGYVVFTDSFMSGWGGAAKGRSLYALAVSSPAEAETVIASGKRRSEMKRPRIFRDRGRMLRSMKPNDHLSIADIASADRWFQADGFGEAK